MRKLSYAALAALMTLEGLRLVPYQDGAGVWTDGYGNTHGVVPNGPAITMEKAERDLRAHTDRFAAAVDKSLTKSVTQAQFDAYTLFTYNIGEGAWRSSSTLKAHNRGDYMDACLYMLRWTKITDPKTKKKVESRGLWNRRYVEYNKCISGVPNVQWTEVQGR